MTGTADATPTRSASSTDRAPTRAPDATRLLSRAEWAVVALAFAVALVPELAVIARALRDRSLHWTGAIGGTVPEDAQQYIAWVVDSSRHVLIGNLFSLAPPQRVFLHPAIAFSGILHSIGLRADLALAIWVPVGLAALLIGTVRFAHAFLDDPLERAAALAIAIFFAFPPILNRLLIESGSAGSRGLSATSIDSAAIVNMWGYPLSVLAFALLPFGLLAHSRARSADRRFSPSATCCLIASAWLQPWQGLVGLATVIGLEVAVRARRARSGERPGGDSAGLSLAISTSAAAALPIAGYAYLGATDPAFIATGPNTAWVAATETWWTVLLAVLPLLAFAAVGAKLPARATAGDLMLRIWPAACIGVALAMSIGGIDAQSSHALRGISIPLAVLAVLGWRRSASFSSTARSAFAVVVAGAVGLFLVVGTVERSVAQWRAVDSTPGGKGFFIASDDRRALDWLRQNPEPGGVVAAGRLGPLVPAMADRQVWNGHWNWTPEAGERRLAVASALGLKASSPASLIGLSPGEFVSATGARFLLLGCGSSTPQAIRRMAPVTASVERFGCATVIVLRPASRTDRELVSRSYGR